MAQITERYRDLQGLRLVAGGVGLLGTSAVLLLMPLSLQDMRATGPAPAEWGAVALVIDFAAMLIAIKLVSRWYDRRYGRVRQTPHQRRLDRVVGGVGAVSFLVPFELEILAMNAGWRLPFNLILAVISVAIVGYWLYLGRAFAHYLAIACFGLVLTVLSAAGIPPNTFASHVREAVMFFALASIAGGVLDHLILARALGSRSHVDVDT